MDRPPVPVTHADQLLNAFGYWPSFHDAEVHRAELDRGSPDRPPSVTLLVNAYDVERTADERGYHRVRTDVMVTLHFAGVADLELRDLGGQNVLSELVLEPQPDGRVAVELGPCYGLSGVFTCAAVSVADVRPRDPTADWAPGASPGPRS